MFQQSVNLLPKDLLKKSRQRKEIAVLAIKIGYFLLASLLFLTLFIFLPTFILTKKVKNVQEQVNEKRKIIEDEAAWEELIRLAERQLAALKELEEDKLLMSNQLEYLDSFLGTDLTLSNFHGDKEIVSLSANTSSLLSFANFITNLQKAKKIEGIELTASSLDKEEGQYNFSLNLFFQ